MKRKYHFIFQKKKNIHFIVTMYNSHKMSWSSFAPRRVLFPVF